MKSPSKSKMKKGSTNKSRISDSVSEKEKGSLLKCFKKYSESHRPLEIVSKEAAEKIEEHVDDLEKCIENYLDSWSEKCMQSSNTREGGPLREQVDLDRHGMKVVQMFQECAEEACARGSVPPGQYLDYLVLVMRNDIVHQSSQVSRAAYDCLVRHWCRYPYATVAAVGGGDCVSVHPESVWLPFFTERQSFGSKYLMYQDMSLSGCQWHKDHNHQSSKSRKNSSAEVWGHTDEMILNFLEKALESDEKDFNGDLLLLDYLTRVVDQDLQCRARIIDQFRSDKDEKKKYLGQLRALLENSALWRIIVGMRWNPKVVEKIVACLVQLIVDFTGDEEDLEMAEEEPEDDSPAGACAFSKAGLAGIASRLLNNILTLFGAMESIGGFLATSSHRSASSNYRIAIDDYLVASFWLERGYCKHLEAANALLSSLDPRDAMRLIGFVAAHKFTRAYDTTYLQKSDPRCIEEVKTLFDAMDAMSLRSKDLDSFFEIEMNAVLSSIMVDMSRSIKMYRTADHVALLLASIATSVSKLLVDGKSIPVKGSDVTAFTDQLKDCIQKLRDQELSTNSAHKLHNLGSIYLSQAEMLLMTH